MKILLLIFFILVFISFLTLTIYYVFGKMTKRFIPEFWLGEKQDMTESEEIFILYDDEEDETTKLETPLIKSA